MNKKIIVVASVIFLILSVSILILYNRAQNIPKVPDTSEIPNPTDQPKYIPKKPSEFSQKDMAEQEKADIEFGQAMDRYQKENPLLQLMPVLNADFHIEYQGKGNYKVTLFGKDKKQSKLESQQWWQSYNIDSSRINITYIEAD